MKTITLQDLKDMEPRTIFDSGVSTTLNLIEGDLPLQWVAIRGGIHDWAIYASHPQHSLEWTASRGDKVHNRDTVQRLVPCDKEALGMYRD